MPNGLTKTAQVEHHILNVIAQDKIGQGGRLASEKVLARDLGVGVVTVQRAMAELARRNIVRRVQGKGTFAQRRVTGRSCLGTVAFLLVNRTTARYDHLLEESREAAQRRRYDLRLITTGERPNNVVVASLSGVAGALVSGAVDDDWAEFLETMHIPAVLVGRYSLAKPALSVQLDMGGAAEALVRRLHSRGARRIGLINGASTYPPSKVLYDGYRKALHELKLPMDDNRVIWCRRDHRLEDIAAFFARGASFDALVIEAGSYHPLLLHFYKTCAPPPRPILGVISPAALAPEDAACVESVAFREDLGEQAIRLLFDAISGLHTPRTVLVPPDTEEQPAEASPTAHADGAPKSDNP